MSDNNVTMEMVEEELFKIVKGEIPTSADAATGRVKAARLLLEILERRAQEDAA